jgi:hypothetical protein
MSNEVNDKTFEALCVDPLTLEAVRRRWIFSDHAMLRGLNVKE